MIAVFFFQKAKNYTRFASTTKSYFRKPFIDKLYPLHKTNFLLLLFNNILCLQIFYSNLFPSQINIISPPKKTTRMPP